MNLLVKMAIRAGAADLVRFHLQRGGHVNRQDDSGTSLLMYAASRGHAEICQILLDHFPFQGGAMASSKVARGAIYPLPGYGAWCAAGS